jgi:phosphopantothenoylcysteine decarboxylase/phosphopantothenate--cysteine ligase
MQAAMDETMGKDLDMADALIMTAAVADFRPAAPKDEKIKRSGAELTIQLVANPDLLAEVGRKRTGPRPVLIGFALETKQGDELMALGRNKLIDKQVDMVVANSAADSLGTDDTKVLLVSARDCTPLDKMSKFEVAAEILLWLSRRLEEPTKADQTH